MNEDLTRLWMVPYADLMSTMVLLFMSLFAYSYTQRSPEYERALARLEKDVAAPKQAGPAAKRLDEAELAVKIKQEMRRLTLQDFGVQVTSRYVRLTLPSPVLFGEGSEALSPQAAGVLAPLAGLFAECSNPILVEGHTDDVRIAAGRFRSNWELSAARALSVVQFFVNDQGLEPARFHARGYGEYRPLAPNDTLEDRAKNRRIEISLIREIRRGEP